MVLSLESAPAHLAAALNKPGVFLLGGGHYGMFAPWQRSERQIWLSEAMDCYNCQWHCSMAEAFCVTRIKPVTIANALLALERAQSTRE
jgi:ADP-heptose:LPS heptosyltransferase